LHRARTSFPTRRSSDLVMADLQQEGKVRALGLSEVSVAQVQDAEQYFTVASVQNRYNLTDRRSEDVLTYCTEQQIAFIPWAPLEDRKSTRLNSSHVSIS